jgi:hypothetical protein
MKVSKEEIVGMVKAIEMLRSGKRNRDVEDKQWRSWFLHITNTVSKVPGVSGEIIEPKDKQYYPTMKVVWDPKKIGITAGEIGKQFARRRAAHHDARRAGGEQQRERDAAAPRRDVGDEYKIVADRIHEILAKAPGPRTKPTYAAPAGDVSGMWEAEIRFKVGSAKHTFYLDPKGNQISGQYTGRLIKGPLKGHVDGNKVEFSSTSRIEGTSLHYTYQGTFDGKQMSGTLDMGEYGKASFSATKKA